MSIQTLRIVFNGSHRNGTPNDRDEFARLLGEQPPYAFTSQPSRFAALNLEIGNFNIEDYAHFGIEGCEEFEKDLQACLANFAQWLATLSTENLERMRASGWHVWVIVNIWMDQDQMEFNLFPNLSLQLGRLGLKLYIISNE